MTSKKETCVWPRIIDTMALPRKIQRTIREKVRDEPWARGRSVIINEKRKIINISGKSGYRSMKGEELPDYQAPIPLRYLGYIVVPHGIIELTESQSKDSDVSAISSHPDGLSSKQVLNLEPIVRCMSSTMDVYFDGNAIIDTQNSSFLGHDRLNDFSALNYHFFCIKTLPRLGGIFVRNSIYGEDNMPLSDKVVPGAICAHPNQGSVSAIGTFLRHRTSEAEGRFLKYCTTAPIRVPPQTITYYYGWLPFLVLLICLTLLPGNIFTSLIVLSSLRVTLALEQYLPQGWKKYLNPGSYLTIHKQFPHFVLEAIILLPLFLSTPCEVMLNSLSYHFGLPQIPSFIIAVQLRVVWVGFIALCSPNIPWASKYSPYSMLHSTRVRKSSRDVVWLLPWSIAEVTYWYMSKNQLPGPPLHDSVGVACNGLLCFHAWDLLKLSLGQTNGPWEDVPIQMAFGEVGQIVDYFPCFPYSEEYGLRYENSIAVMELREPKFAFEDCVELEWAPKTIDRNVDIFAIGNSSQIYKGAVGGIRYVFDHSCEAEKVDTLILWRGEKRIWLSPGTMLVCRHPLQRNRDSPHKARWCVVGFHLHRMDIFPMDRERDNSLDDFWNVALRPSRELKREYIPMIPKDLVRVLESF